ncbi:hypothetical protein C8Q75DRAFT_887046 [Abortiporus biennis]|nr:hypothetical protein C8Q75DRAFT_887046 [Abortiporus biennis]
MASQYFQQTSRPLHDIRKSRSPGRLNPTPSPRIQTRPNYLHSGAPYPSEGVTNKTQTFKKPYRLSVTPAPDEDKVISSVYHEFETFGRDESSRKLRYLPAMDEDDLMDLDFDEESTLTAMLQDDISEDDQTEHLVALADQLKAPMTAEAQKLKEYMRDTIVPVIQQVRNVHDTLEDEADMAFGAGILAFDEVCKEVESTAVFHEQELQDAYRQLQLGDAYTRREQLWVAFEANLEHCAAEGREAIETLPGEVEDTITRLEKKSKDMEKKGNTMASRSKMLKGLLEKL